jgi:hypothetical protein
VRFYIALWILWPDSRGTSLCPFFLHETTWWTNLWLQLDGTYRLRPTHRPLDTRCMGNCLRIRSPCASRLDFGTEGEGLHCCSRKWTCVQLSGWVLQRFYKWLALEGLDLIFWSADSVGVAQFFAASLPSDDETWQWQNPSFIDDFLLKPLFIWYQPGIPCIPHCHVWLPHWVRWVSRLPQGWKNLGVGWSSDWAALQRDWLSKMWGLVNCMAAWLLMCFAQGIRTNCLQWILATDFLDKDYRYKSAAPWCHAELWADCREMGWPMP